MTDPPLSDIDFKNKMAWVWTTLKSIKNRFKTVFKTVSIQKTGNTGISRQYAVFPGEIVIKRQWKFYVDYE